MVSPGHGLQSTRVHSHPSHFVEGCLGLANARLGPAVVSLLRVNLVGLKRCVGPMELFGGGLPVRPKLRSSLTYFCMCAVGAGDSAGHDAAQRVASGSASTESMARLEHLRNDSYTGRSAGWDDRSGRHGSAGGGRGGGDLDDIDYMSEEGEEDADLSADELASGSDGIRPGYRDGRCASLPGHAPLQCRAQAIECSPACLAQL